MLKLFFFLFKESYKELNGKKEKIISKPYFINQKKNNFRINYYVLSRLNIFFKKHKNHHQFILDSVVYYLNKHLKKRISIYKTSYFLGPYFFILTSITHIFLISFASLIRGIFLFSKRYKVPQTNSKEIIINIGFPEHSFSFQNNPDNPGSLIEYLDYVNIYKNRKIGYFSLDEYVRPSYTSKDNRKLIQKNLTRFKLYKKFNLLEFINIPFRIFKSFIIYLGKYNIRSISFFSFYLDQHSTWDIYERLLTKLKQRDIKTLKIIMMHNHNIGIIKYQNIKNNLSVFSYSQNYFIAPARNIIRELINPNNNLKSIDILSELNLNNFSNFYFNQINLHSTVKLFNLSKKILNKKLQSNLMIYRQNSIKKKSFSNLGYEFLNKIKLSKKKFNIIFFDVTIESEETILSRIINGDIISSEKFGFSFYKDLIKLISDCDCQFYFKPKYSLKKNTNQNFYKFLKRSDIEVKNKIKVIDPYGKIILNKQKFDLMINYPFTSTNYTFDFLTKNRIYYVPGIFKDEFINISDNLILGYNNLLNLIKKLK